MIDGAEVGAWDPPIAVSAAVAHAAALEQFAARARSGYSAPPIGYDEPEEMLVGGRHFAVVTRARGMVEASVHTLPRFRWRQAFEPVQRIVFAPDQPVLVAASAGHGNYYHWVAETAAAVVLHRQAWPDAAIPLVVPPPNGWQRDLLATLGLDNPLVVVAAEEALVCDAGVLASLTGPGHGFAPHPAMLRVMREQAPEVAADPSRRRRLYVSRLDAGDRRRMINEVELCAALAGLGLEIVVASTLSVCEQIALFREAELVVAPHGAALATLLFAGDGADGPAVVELFGDNYLNRCFLKLCQGKRLRYRAVVSPCVSPGAHHHQSTWRADIPLVLDAVAGAFRE